MTTPWRPRAIFLDDGGVMNDNGLRGPQWARLVGEFLAPRLGGTPERWAAANQSAEMQKLWRGLLTRDAPSVDDLYRVTKSEQTFAALYERYRITWVRLMCEDLDLSVPSDNDALALEAEASAYVTSRIDAAFPGASEAIRSLHRGGYTLHTASGEISAELSSYLTGMKVRDCFGHLFGPDVVDVWKGGLEYYRRIFAHADIDPTDALVVDDSEQQCIWATEVGAHVIRITTEQSAFESAASLRVLSDSLLA